MWKRLNFSNRTRENLAESSSPTPEDEFISRPYAIPTLQFNDSSPQQAPRPTPNHVAHHSIAASSIYSQYPQNTGATLSAPWHDDGFDISPPSSPGGSTILRAREAEDGGVSPIEETSSVDELPFQINKKPTSQIPRLRKISSNPRAEALLREPVVDTADKTVALSEGNPYYDPDRTLSPNNSRYAEQLQKHGNFASRATYFASKGLKAVAPKATEPWSRTAGRTAVMDAVQDTPQPKVAIPPRNPRRPSPAVTPVATPPVSTDTRAQEQIPEPFPAMMPEDANLPYYKTQMQTPTPGNPGGYFTKPPPQNDDTLAQLSAGEPYPGVSNLSRKDRSEDPVSRFSWTTYATGTTHRTSEYDPEGSPTSPPPPIPADLQAKMNRKSLQRKEVGGSSPSPSTPMEKESVLERKRPIARDEVPSTPKTATFPTSHISIASVRKPVGGARATDDLGLGISSAPPVKALTERSSTLPVQNDAKSKALPKAPGILSATLTRDSASDQIAELRQQIEDLRFRRSNVNRAIQKLTSAAFATQNPMVTNWRAAKESEKRVDSLKSELADMGREEYELGLKLHRAYKRSEREGGMEGTSALWVRRVTS